MKKIATRSLVDLVRITKIPSLEVVAHYKPKYDFPIPAGSPHTAALAPPLRIEHLV
jgi:hypothetical protein